jgi:tRNA-dihydrouridine synthase
LEEPDTLLPVVRALVATIRVPVSVKVRLLPNKQEKENHVRKNIDNDGNNDDDVQSPEQGYNDDDEDGDDCRQGENCDTAIVPPEYQPSLEASLRLYRQLVDAGVHMLTIHGRTRYQKGPWTSKTDWSAIRQVVQELGDRIPILANGSISCAQDAKDCLEITGCDGIMSSEGLLEYPPLLQSLVVGSSNNDTPSLPLPSPSLTSLSQQRRRVGRVELCRQYLKYAKQYPPDQGGQGSGLKCIRIHIHRFCHADLQDETPDGRRLRDAVIKQRSLEGLEAVVDQIQAFHDATGHDVQTEELSWYRRYTELDENGEYVNVMQKRRNQDAVAKPVRGTDHQAEDEEESKAMNMATFFGSADDNEDW